MGTDTVDSREYLPLVERRRHDSVVDGSLELDVHQPVERNRSRDQAFDKCVLLAYVLHDDRRKPQHPGAVAPSQSGGRRDIPPRLVPSVRRWFRRSSCHGLDHRVAPFCVPLSGVCFKVQARETTTILVQGVTSVSRLFYVNYM
jgi:hypothetical protein